MSEMIEIPVEGLRNLQLRANCLSEEGLAHLIANFFADELEKVLDGCVEDGLLEADTIFGDESERRVYWLPEAK